jgi:hypothetical protein
MQNLYQEKEFLNEDRLKKKKATNHAIKVF